MAKLKEQGLLNIEDAMANLSAIAGIDLDNPPRLGVIRGNMLVADGMEIGSREVLWLSGEGSEGILEILDLTFDAVRRHFEAQIANSEIDWKSPKIRKGIAAMFALAGEAAQIIDGYLALRMGRPMPKKTISRASYQQLEHIYRSQLEKKIFGEEDEVASEDLDGMFDQPKAFGIKDFEAIRKDWEYELFFIKNESGEPYFDPKILRNVKLSCDFSLSQEGDFEEDPLLRVHAIQDRDLQTSARQIADECKFEIEGLYRARKEISQNSLMDYLSQAVIALYLASNPRNLSQTSSGKSCLQYFGDFHLFLRSALSSSEYQKLIAYPEESKDPALKALLTLTHALCRGLFYRLGGVKQEVIGLLHRYMRKGEEKNKKRAIKGETIYNQFLIDDEKFRTLLSHYPNGPLFKILDFVREEDLELLAFDPLGQGNLPQRICEISGKGTRLAVLRFPCPIRQTHINRAELAPEFAGFLRSYPGKKKHLMINLQDRTSWKEATRSQAMEQLQKNANFNDHFAALTLPKATDFYCQSQEYQKVGRADEFIQQFKSQIASAEECGFFFPLQWPKAEIEDFSNRALPLIHELFFESKSNLSRRNREDFIEVFYQLFLLKIIEMAKPESISFTCKDGIDTGAAAAASFLGWVSFLSGDFSNQKDFLRWVLYAPALLIRERCIDSERLMRTLSLWETVGLASEEKGFDLSKAIGGLYQAGWIKSLRIE